MQDISLLRLERVLKNLPIVGEPTMLHTPCQHGEVYIGYGKDGNGVYHGAWGVGEGGFDMGQPALFNPGVTEEQVRKVLFVAAADWAENCSIRGLYGGNGGRVQ